MLAPPLLMTEFTTTHGFALENIQRFTTPIKLNIIGNKYIEQLIDPVKNHKIAQFAGLFKDFLFEDFSTLFNDLPRVWRPLKSYINWLNETLFVLIIFLFGNPAQRTYL